MSISEDDGDGGGRISFLIPERFPDEAEGGIGGRVLLSRTAEAVELRVGADGNGSNLPISFGRRRLELDLVIETWLRHSCTEWREPVSSER